MDNKNFKIMLRTNKTIILFGKHADHEEQERLEQVVEERTVRSFVELYNSSPSDNLVWKGTARDLVELTHFVWLRGVILDESGRPVTFKAMVTHIFTVLHRPAPRHPNSVMSKVNSRKNVSMKPLLARYYVLMTEGGITNPVRTDVSFLAN